MDFQIEDLFFKQVSKPKHHSITKIINVFGDHYRINVYIEIEDEGLIKRKIAQSYMTTFKNNTLNIIPDPDKKPDDLKKKR